MKKKESNSEQKSKTGSSGSDRVKKLHKHNKNEVAIIPIKDPKTRLMELKAGLEAAYINAAKPKDKALDFLRSESGMALLESLDLKQVFLPIRYKDRPDDVKNIIEFLEIYYLKEGWLTGSFDRSDFKRIDPEGAAALNSWLAQNNHKLPKNLNLPKAMTNEEKVHSGRIEELEKIKNRNAAQDLELRRLKDTRRKMNKNTRKLQR